MILRRTTSDEGVDNVVMPISACLCAYHGTFVRSYVCVVWGVRPQDRRKRGVGGGGGGEGGDGEWGGRERGAGGLRRVWCEGNGKQAYAVKRAMGQLEDA